MNRTAPGRRLPALACAILLSTALPLGPAMADNAPAASPAAPAPADPAAQAKARSAFFDKLVADEVALGPDRWRVDRLALSPRRSETVHITSGSRRLTALVVHPTTTGPAPIMLMVPEDQGLNTWAHDMADQIAARGYIVVVPDLFSGMGPRGGDRDAFTDLHAVFATAAKLVQGPADQLTPDLNAWADYARALPGTNGKMSVSGFGWGGGRAFRFAAQRPGLAAAYVFYDAAPPADALSGVTAPVYGFYAQHDTRVTRSLPVTIEAMNAQGKTFEPVIYAGSDHMFMRLGEEPRDTNPADAIAMHQAWARFDALLARYR